MNSDPHPHVQMSSSPLCFNMPLKSISQVFSFSFFFSNAVMNAKKILTLYILVKVNVLDVIYFYNYFSQKLGK